VGIGHSTNTIGQFDSRSSDRLRGISKNLNPENYWDIVERLISLPTRMFLNLDVDTKVKGFFYLHDIKLQVEWR